MDWKSEAKGKLLEYETRRCALESIPAELRRLELEACSIRSAAGDSTPVQGGGSRREDAMLTNIVRRGELERQLENARGWVALVDAGLAGMDEEERLILERLYIHRQRGAITRLMDELGWEKSTVYRKRDSALRRFTMALYGGMES